MKYQITDEFWKKYRELVKTQMIPYQWAVLNDKANIVIEKERDADYIPNEKSHAIENFKIAAGRAEGEHYGWVFQDSDVYKWLEAVAYSLADHPDEELQTIADEVVELIGAAQCEDGYLNTYFTTRCPEKRYKRLGESHELYCAGHYIEAAIAYNEATGSKESLAIAVKLADRIDADFGPEEGKIHGYDGHEEIELALMRLSHAIGNDRYMKLAEYFLRERGKDPDFFRKQVAGDDEAVLGGLYSAPDSYFQNHLPITEQTTAEGHAVRLVYMGTALADLAATGGSRDLIEASKTIWENMVNKRMYITGGIGSTVNGESFTLDYDLPNDTMYCETCAAIGEMFYARQMLRIENNASYGDVMERALYNSVISGMALDGKHFFYVNPLEVDPKKDKKDPTKSHVKPVRPAWLGCACCPPNLARLITSLEKYIYTFKENEILVNLFVDSTITESFGEGEITLVQKTNYPKTGKVDISVGIKKAERVKLLVRIPGWTDEYKLEVNGEKSDFEVVAGFAVVEGVGDGDLITLDMDMKVKRYYSNNNVTENIGKVALCRGPIVYCIEEADNGANLHLLTLPKGAELNYVEEAPIGSLGCIDTTGTRTILNESVPLYYSGEIINRKEVVKMKFIPYHVWANRGENEMRVWVNEL